jgi:hypothetical protein
VEVPRGVREDATASFIDRRSCGVALTFATDLAAHPSSEGQIQKATQDLSSLVVL